MVCIITDIVIFFFFAQPPFWCIPNHICDYSVSILVSPLDVLIRRFMTSELIKPKGTLLSHQNVSGDENVVNVKKVLNATVHLPREEVWVGGSSHVWFSYAFLKVHWVTWFAWLAMVHVGGSCCTSFPPLHMCWFSLVNHMTRFQMFFPHKRYGIGPMNPGRTNTHTHRGGSYRLVLGSRGPMFLVVWPNEIATQLNDVRPRKSQWTTQWRPVSARRQ